MNTTRLGFALIIVGVLGGIASVGWWLWFYTTVVHFLNGPNAQLPSDTLQCLVSSSGPCGFITGVASATGMISYNPMALWLSGLAILIGIIVTVSSDSKPTRSV